MAGIRGVVWRDSLWGPGAGETVDAGTMDIAELLGPDLEGWRSLRARSPAVAARRLAGRAAVRDLVQEHDLFAWRGYEPTGRGRKPAFVGARADFSIAHSADRMFVAILEDGRIGVDIESVDPVFDSAALQRRMCSPTELMCVQEIAPSARRGWLARLWTAKEAISKIDGRGLGCDFRSIEILPMSTPRTLEDPFVAAIATRSTDPAGGLEVCHPVLSGSEQAQRAD